MPLKVVRRKGRKYLIIRGTIGGRRIEESAGTADKRIAEEKRAARERELYRADIYGPASTATWPQAVNLYLDAGGEDRFLGRLTDHFGTKPLLQIDQAAVNEAARALYPTASAETIVRQVITPITAVLTAAAENGLCTARRFKRPKRGKKAHRTYAKRDWIAAFVNHADAELAALALFMAFTGCRIGEAIALDWENVDLQAARAILVRTKTDPRRVRLPEPLVVALANLSRKGRVFGFDNRWQVYRPWRACCKAAGIPIIMPHQAGRHTFASWLLADGHSIKLVKEAGGWKSIQLVSDIYGHLEQDHIDGAVAALGHGWGKESKMS